MHRLHPKHGPLCNPHLLQSEWKLTMWGWQKSWSWWCMCWACCLLCQTNWGKAHLRAMMSWDTGVGYGGWLSWALFGRFKGWLWLFATGNGWEWGLGVEGWFWLGTAREQRSLWHWVADGASELDCPHSLPHAAGRGVVAGLRCAVWQGY